MVEIKANEERIRGFFEHCLMLVTALNPVVGYDNAAKIAKTALSWNVSLKDPAEELGILSREDFKMLVKAENILNSSDYNEHLYYLRLNSLVFTDVHCLAIRPTSCILSHNNSFSPVELAM